MMVGLGGGVAHALFTRFILLPTSSNMPADSFGLYGVMDCCRRVHERRHPDVCRTGTHSLYTLQLLLYGTLDHPVFGVSATNRCKNANTTITLSACMSSHV
jgi:hypothetical protein